MLNAPHLPCGGPVVPTRRQRGAALITALLIVTIAVSVSAALVARQEVDMRRSGNLLHEGQATLYWRGVENWAAQILGRDAEETGFDHPGEIWGQTPPAMPVEGGSIEGRLLDMHAYFNLNSLLDSDGEPNEAAVALFQRLLINLELSDDIAIAVLDWLDSDQQQRFPGGAEDGHYLGQARPYRAANRPMHSVSELRLVAGVNREAWQALRPHVAALPDNTAINVNSAGPELLAALADGLDPGQFERLVEQREDQAYESVRDFLAHQAFAGQEIDTELLTVNSNYFMLHARITVGQFRNELYSLLHRQQNGRTSVVSRRRGTR